MSYEAVTEGVRVVAEPRYLPERSSPEDGLFVWAYTIRIVNGGARRLRLMTRHWRIIDARGHEQTVDGPGVVGMHPTLAPGEEFEYTSGCPLNTPSGVMVGGYRMEDDAGNAVDVAIPAFSLDSPHQDVRLQ